MSYILILAMAVVAVLLVAVVGFMVWLVVDALCARLFRL
jgi:hypothetical protein